MLYSHFAGKDAIVRAVALEGFAELAGALRAARPSGSSPEAALLATARVYVKFGRARPALYDAMFVLADLPFAQAGTPAPLVAAFAELRRALAPLVRDRDPETLAEVAWSALHGLVTLERSGRLRPGLSDQRVALVVEQLSAPRETSPVPVSKRSNVI